MEDENLSIEWEVSDTHVMNDMQTCDLRSESVNLVSFECEKYFITPAVLLQQRCEKYFAVKAISVFLSTK